MCTEDDAVDGDGEPDDGHPEYIGVGIALGAEIGVALGATVFDDVAIGIAVDIGIGLAMGA